MRLADPNERELYLEDLVDLVDGQTTAWRTFQRRMEPRLRRVCRETSIQMGYRLSKVDLSDVVQDVVYRLVDDDYRRLRMFRPEIGTTLAGWIGRIAASTTRDFVRASRRARTQHDLLSCQELDHFCANIPNPEQLLATKRRNDLVAEQIDRLSHRDRHFLRHYFRVGLEPRQISNEMGIALSTVYSKKAKILRHIIAFVSALEDPT
ncbi:MAG: sigma-70 family RNA polymerase sigma factor [Deltaproteobacteria bacterium]|nr:sigma-70 family RNA polymerase sigma factor [Deltaproteobacteria bacterium]